MADVRINGIGTDNHLNQESKLDEQVSNRKVISMLKDEIREYKRQIKVLKRTIEELKKE